jgi:hypothetical protein
MAGLAIRAGFAAVIMPDGAADQRKHEQKRSQYGAELYGSNCAVSVHSNTNIQCTPDAAEG